MAEPSTLARWLPTLLGATIALGTVAAYELGEDPEPNCDDEPATEASSETATPRRRDPLFAGAPHPAERKAEEQALAMEDQVAALQVQNELLAERAVTGELGYYGQSQAELEAMARHCDVRMDYPKPLSPEEIEDLGLEPAEQEAYQRAIARFSAQEGEHYRRILAELEPDNPELEAMSLADVRRRLTRVISKARAEGDDELQRHVAQERAGLREPPEDRAQLSAFNRYHRLRFNAGDRFAELLGDELGDARVHELRAALNGWSGGRTRQVGCPGEASD